MSIYDEALEECQDEINESHGIVKLPKTITALNQAKQLEKDIKRYMELDCDDKTFSKEEHNEFVALLEKLLKVGK